MPILDRESDIHPPDLLSRIDEPNTEDPSQWWVLYTLPRREKDLMRRLRALDVPFYGPLVQRKSRTPGGRTIRSWVPLFAGYVFLHATEQQRHTTLTTNCVSRCLAVPSQEELVADLLQVQRLISSNAPLTPEARIEPGMRVRIRSGSLAGLEGTVVQRRGEERLIVAVRFLQQGASIELTDFSVERIS